MKHIQNELNNLYLDYLNKLIDDNKFLSYLNNDVINSPLAINSNVVRGNYFNSDMKILFVGKENNGWFGLNEREKSGINNISNKDEYLHGLLDLYNRFNLGENYRTPIFSYMDILIDKLRDKKINTGILWSNLLRIDCGNDLKDEIFGIDNNVILRKEIELLKPDVVLFVTGPNYDKYLGDTFSNIRKIHFENKSIKEFCILEHEILPKKSFRIYHPNYYPRLGADYRFILVETIVKLLV